MSPALLYIGDNHIASGDFDGKVNDFSKKYSNEMIATVMAGKTPELKNIKLDIDIFEGEIVAESDDKEEVVMSSIQLFISSPNECPTCATKNCHQCDSETIKLARATFTKITQKSR